MSRLPLQGKVAVVTGGARGIGKALASAIVGAGADVLLVSRTQAELEQTAAQLRPAGRTVDTVVADVSQPDEVKRIVERVRTGPDRVDILVNGAGVQGPIGIFSDNDSNAWLETIKVNLFGVFLCCRAVIPFMRRQGGGKILNLSGGGATTARPNFSAYAASKAAVVRLTETLAEELKTDNIQVNAIAPGALPTRMTEEIIEAGACAGPKAMSEAQIAWQRRASPFARVEGLAVFLASAESNGLTGKLISAEWDEWETFSAKMDRLLTSDIYTLRRVT